MIFASYVNGIPCQVHVLDSKPEEAPTEDCPGDPATFDYELLDTKGKRARWLDQYITPAVDKRLEEEHHIMVQGEIAERIREWDYV